VGDGNGSFNWDSGLTRAELAVLIVRLRGDEGKVTANIQNYTIGCYFNDVPAWAKPYVGYCAGEGLMIGYSRYQFGPNDKVTPQQACTVILRHKGFQETDWSYATAISKAASAGITPSAAFADMSEIKRAEMAIVIHKAELQGANASDRVLFPPPLVDAPDDDYSNKFTLPDSLFYSDGSLGTLSIPKLDMSAKVYEEENLDNLAIGIGHFKSTSCWEGNVGFAAHNRGQAGYFGQIETLKNGDRIVYTTKLGTHTYEVFFVGQIRETDYSKLGRTDDNIVTLITCVRDVPSMRWCVQAKQVP